jgi:hypothetical protein
MIQRFKFYSFLIIPCLAGTLATCSQPVKDNAGTKIPFKGLYTWAFDIPGMGKQLSAHTFYADSIRYEMTGNAYTNSYTQQLIAYDATEQRCVTRAGGGGKDGVYFVLFFKDITPVTITIYKKQCDTKEEAMTLPVPDAATKANHGWNIYHRK